MSFPVTTPAAHTPSSSSRSGGSGVASRASDTARSAIDDDLQRIAEQELLLRFVRFDADNAWDLGLRLRAAAASRGHAVAIVIALAGLTQFQGMMPGAVPVLADSARRQANVVRRFHTSSYAVGLRLQRDRTTLEAKYGLGGNEYSPTGGSFPLWVTTAGCVGSLTVAGLSQRENHRLIVGVLTELLGIKAPQLEP
jgi:uncharacterized protein (UPF0303 family)